MHESALVYRILSEIQPAVAPGCTLKTVLLEVGEFSCVNTATLEQLYDIASKNTFAAHSRLKLIVKKNNADIFIKAIEVKK